MMTKKYKVTEMKGEKFQEEALDSAQCCLPQIRKNSQRKKASPTDGPIRELKPQADEGELIKYQHLAMISFFSKSSLAYDSTLDDNKLLILHLLPQS